jgi:hypothetical protein
MGSCEIVATLKNPIYDRVDAVQPVTVSALKK